ncbi:hypothetical protein BaRGS_00002568 [Batillaria attramentaria]|uniref:Uncharacterized protein n=1 Tax=Batillaria attramentaria TaxID=370345 RepID=A0ABD0M3V3_9CAEN
MPSIRQFQQSTILAKLITVPWTRQEARAKKFRPVYCCWIRPRVGKLLVSIYRDLDARCREMRTIEPRGHREIESGRLMGANIALHTALVPGLISEIAYCGK